MSVGRWPSSCSSTSRSHWLDCLVYQAHSLPYLYSRCWRLYHVQQLLWAFCKKKSVTNHAIIWLCRSLKTWVSAQLLQPEHKARNLVCIVIKWLDCIHVYIIYLIAPVMIYFAELIDKNILTHNHQNTTMQCRSLQTKKSAITKILNSFYSFTVAPLMPNWRPHSKICRKFDVLNLLPWKINWVLQSGFQFRLCSLRWNQRDFVLWVSSYKGHAMLQYLDWRGLRLISNIRVLSNSVLEYVQS